MELYYRGIKLMIVGIADGFDRSMLSCLVDDPVEDIVLVDTWDSLPSFVTEVRRRFTCNSTLSGTSSSFLRYYFVNFCVR
eukprot:UN17965